MFSLGTKVVPLTNQVPIKFKFQVVQVSFSTSCSSLLEFSERKFSSSGDLQSQRKFSSSGDLQKSRLSVLSVSTSSSCESCSIKFNSVFLCESCSIKFNSVFFLVGSQKKVLLKWSLANQSRVILTWKLSCKVGQVESSSQSS